MNNQTLKNAILSGKADEQFALLYQNTLVARDRYAKAIDKFTDIFGQRDDIRIFSAPGRTEVGGNHTDHQHGRVLAGSVDLDIIGIVALNDDNVVRIKSEGFPQDTISLDELAVNEAEYGRAASLIRGVLGSFKEQGYNIGGFDAYTTNNVMRGSGLSSSAAFEVFVGTCLNFLFNDGEVSAVEIAKIGQKAESVYFGKPCGLLDQSASALGGFTAIDFKDTAKPVVEQVSFDLESHGFALCVVNTGGNHANLTQDYADITVECRNVSNFFGKGFLREVDTAEFFSKIGELKEKVGDRAVLRAIHFFNEDLRADLEKNALKNDDFNEFLRLISDSGNSSFKFLQNVYSTSNVHEQGISLGIAATEQFIMKSGRGACRVHGGGFAGTVQAFLPIEDIDSYRDFIESIFGKGSCYVLKIRPFGGFELKI